MDLRANWRMHFILTRETDACVRLIDDLMGMVPSDGHEANASGAPPEGA